MMRVAEISASAIRDNVLRLREITHGGAVIAVIKANGYGHGLGIVARAALAGGAEILGVADLEEALALREDGIDAPILCWLHGANIDMGAAVDANIEIGVSNVRQLEQTADAAARLGRVASIHIKVDTGLSRNGASESEWDALFERAAALERARVVRIRGIFSHLANAGDSEDRLQAERFDSAIHRLERAGPVPELRHLAASAATLTSPHLHYNAVRVGVAVMGLSPFPDRTSADFGLKPAMTLKAEIVALRDVPAGTGVSYGFNHRCASETRLALVPIGYADGMPRALNGSGATVTVRDTQCPIVGRIGMDQCIIDLAPLGKRAQSVELSEMVTLFGDPERGDPPVDEWARRMHTINYEIVVGVGPRVNRIAVHIDEPRA